MKNNKKQRIVLIIALSIVFILGGVFISIQENARKAEEIKVDVVQEITEEVPVETEEVDPIYIEGVASWYDYDLRVEGQKCREDDCYSMLNSTCASRDFPKGTKLKVSLLDGNKSIECRVNDYVENEAVIIDLSSYAFRQLSQLSVGLINVRVEDVSNWR